jgi:2-polyprenyl-3-methyl-5-hydroxy-6-metoxy-1,4-benzoquinol methylase
MNSILSASQNNKLKSWYNVHALSLWVKNKKVHLMNLGYIDSSTPKLPELNSFTWEFSSAMLGLYLKTLEGTTPHLQSALELGSGLGGGCLLLKQLYKVEHVLGIDQSFFNVIYSRKKFSSLGINYKKSNAEKLKSLKRQFNLILSIEMSQHIINTEAFFKGIHDSLLPNGVFCYSDIFNQNEVPALKKTIEKCGLIIIHEVDLTKGVCKSIELMGKQSRQSFIQKAEKLFLNTDEFEPYINSKLHTNLVSGKFIYLSFKISVKNTLN